ncbi:MAG: GTP pyrophosphokinase family protein [Clostridia bacterium]|nr:GTP pyrophosphokinase family protein [Clostridia bacterium]
MSEKEIKTPSQYRNRIEELFGDDFLEQSKEWLQQYNKLMAYYRCAIMEIETKLNVLNEEFSLRHDRNPINDIKSRLKHPISIKEKLERRGLPLTPDSIEQNLGDVAGVRVICSFPEDVYTLADALLSQDDITLIEKKDYIEHPKENGYRSLHLIVNVPIFLAHEKRSMKVEIQLRTIAMDVWASLEHQLRYKKEFEFTEAMAKELLHCASLSAELDARMDALRNLVNLSENQIDPEK